MAKKTVLQAAKQVIEIWNFTGDLGHPISLPQGMRELEEAIDQKTGDTIPEEFTNLATGKKVIIPQ